MRLFKKKKFDPEEWNRVKKISIKKLMILNLKIYGVIMFLSVMTHWAKDFEYWSWKHPLVGLLIVALIDLMLFIELGMHNWAVRSRKKRQAQHGQNN